MREDNERDFWPDWLCRGMGGIDTGVFAAVPLLGWFCILGILNDRHWWAGFNLAAWPFFRDRVFSMGLSIATLTGVSFLLFLYGSLGFLLGLWFRPDSAWGVLARGLILGLAWHFFADRWFWSWISPYSSSYFAARMMLPGHLLWALFLLRYPRRYESVARTFGDPSLWPEPPVETAVEPEPVAEIAAARAIEPAAELAAEAEGEPEAGKDVAPEPIPAAAPLEGDPAPVQPRGTPEEEHRQSPN